MIIARRPTRLLHDSALYGLSAVLAKALALLTIPFLTRALTPSGYGLADLATATAALLTLVAMFSGDIPTARLYGMATTDESRRRVLTSYVWASACIGTALMLALLISSELVTTLLWGLPAGIDVVWLAAVLVPLGAVQAALVQAQRIQARPRTFAVLSFADLLSQLGLAVAFVAMGMGPLGVLLGFVIGSIFGLLLAAAASHAVIGSRPDFDMARQLVKTGLQFLPNVAAFVMADWVVRGFLASSIGPAAVAEVGVALRIGSVISLAATAFSMAWGPPTLAMQHDQTTARILGRALSQFGILAICGASALALAGPELVGIIAGPDFAQASLILPGFAIAYAFAGSEYVPVVAAGISGRGRRVAVASISGALTQVALGLLLIPSFGVLVVAPVVAASRLASFIALASGVRDLLGHSTARLGSAGVLSLVLVVAIQGLIAAGAPLVLRWGLGGLAIATAMVVVIQPGSWPRSPRVS